MTRRRSSNSRVSEVHTPISEKNRILHSNRRVPKISTTVSSRNDPLKSKSNIAVIVPLPVRKWEYIPIGTSTTVNAVLGKLHGRDSGNLYKIEYDDGIEEEVSLDKLLSLKNGQKKLIFYNSQKSLSKIGNQNKLSPKSTPIYSSRKRNLRCARQDGFLNSADIDIESEEESNGPTTAVTKKQNLQRNQYSSINHRNSITSRSGGKIYDFWSSVKRKYEKSDSDEYIQPRKRAKMIHDETDFRASSSNSFNKKLGNSVFPKKIPLSLKKSDSESDELARPFRENEYQDSFIKLRQKKRRRSFTKLDGQAGKNKRKEFESFKKSDAESSISCETYESNESSETSFSPRRPSRKSGRKRSHKNMKEYNEDEEIYAEDSSNSTRRVTNTKEIFIPISKQNLFRSFHNKFCDVCFGNERNSNKGPSQLIYCQGCSTSIHKNCLGPRSNRDHLVTKIGHENFVLQCRRCIGIAITKDKTAPRLDVCIVCRELGLSCWAFSTKMSARQEEKLRKQNEGIDPITEISSELINNEKNVLFRCTGCKRAFHFEHLPPLKNQIKTQDDIEILRRLRLDEYSIRWRCKDCQDAPAKVVSLVCWRPLYPDLYEDGMTADELCEDEKEYLVKWSNKSYFDCTWMPGNWVWGVTVTAIRKAFLRKNEGINLLPKWSFEEAVPEDFLQIEIVFDVRYDRNFIPRSEKIDKAAANMITEVFVKFKGLAYDEAVWMEPPKIENIERYQSFITAYNEFIDGKYFRQSSTSAMDHRLQMFRKLNFSRRVEMKEQPLQLTGGKMMQYQMEGLNWLLYNFHQKKNVILADEMGLGKTIQIIAFIVAIVKNHSKCWPFLVVAPNSTCLNWRREIKKWAPKLRVVSYFGSKSAMDMAFNYEMFPNNCSDLRAHVVITSYEAPISDRCKSWFIRIKWVGLIVDEGQRLKNDQTLLHTTLKALRIPFQVLLTGTPLQNNKRELFNLLQFLDTSIDAAKLDEKYEELTNENLPQLHDLIRPFFLRRTKLQVLEFLPPVAQMIVPVTMSIVQKKLYKSILAKNPELIKSVFSQSVKTLRPSERGNLNNILMQLRKCLCHPFLYSSAIEDRSFGDQTLYRNLVDASSKFQLLEIMLPKLHKRGHRALIFSQFLHNLDLIEDFLTGLDLPFQRLDGSINSMEKQKRIDEFNAPNSPLFAFLLSTRAGGVGINLATADTVLIMDPDFNPHQDIQALSRAHRIGQQKKMLFFQLMTKGSAEEKIVQLGRKKLALDKALIGRMDVRDDPDHDLESILRFGAEALFNDDDKDDIHYDSASVDKLLDRSLIEAEVKDPEKDLGTRFSFARIWANDKDSLIEYDHDTNSAEMASQFSAWDKILKQREADAAVEALKNCQVFGRGKRSRQIKNYGTTDLELELELDEDINLSLSKHKGSDKQNESANDLDFTDVEQHDEIESLDSYRSIEKDEAILVKSTSVQETDLTKETASKVNLSDGTACHGNIISENQSLQLQKEILINDKNPAYHISRSLFIPPPQQFNPMFYQSYFSHLPNLIPNTTICNYGSQLKGITQRDEITRTYSHQPSTIIYDNMPSSGQISVLPPSQNEIYCCHCGLAHLPIAKVCPCYASVIQIRLMLDKISKCKKSNHNQTIEITLRSKLFEKINERKNIKTTSSVICIYKY